MKVSKVNQQRWVQYFYITFIPKAIIIIIKRNRFNTYMYAMMVVGGGQRSAQTSSDVDYYLYVYICMMGSQKIEGHFWHLPNLMAYIYTCILPVLILARWCWPEHGRIWFSGELQSFPSLSKWILSDTRIITEILWMNFSNHERMTWPFFTHYMAFGCVQLHSLFKPNNL